MSKNNPKSQVKTPMLWKPLAIGVIRNMGVVFKGQEEQSDGTSLLYRESEFKMEIIGPCSSRFRS